MTIAFFYDYDPHNKVIIVLYLYFYKKYASKLWIQHITKIDIVLH